MKQAEFSISLMCLDFLDVKGQMEFFNERADRYHIDIMDGHYCKNITLSPDFTKALSKVSKLPMDAHLMTTNPGDWLEPMAAAGCEYIAPHAETINVDAFRTINKIESLGCKPGIVLNPATPLDAIRYYIERLEILTIMTVDVGYAQQPFIPEMLPKIQEAADLKAKNGYKYKIQIDGSCNKTTFKRLQDAGAEIFVMGGSGLFSLHEDYKTAYEMAMEQYNEAFQ